MYVGLGIRETINKGLERKINLTWPDEKEMKKHLRANC